MKSVFSTLFLGMAGFSFVFLISAIATSIILTKRDYNTDLNEDWILVGGVFSSSASFRIRRQQGASDMQFVVSTHPRFHAPIYSEQINSTNDDDVYPLTISNLQPKTKYYYATYYDHNNDNDTALKVERQGSFQTPGQEGTRFDFTFALSGNAYTGSNHDVFKYIKHHSPLFLLHLGDFHRGATADNNDVVGNTQKQQIRAMDQVLGSPSQSALYSSTPLVYTYSRRDLAGGGAFPHFPLEVVGSPISAPTYHAFTIGSIRFIVSDLQSEATPTSIYSLRQQLWLFGELSMAAESDDYDFVIWVTTKPWIGNDHNAGNNNKKWFGRDRQQLSDFISHKFQEKQNLLALTASMDMVAFDDGSHTYYGKYHLDDNNNTLSSFPILHSGPLDNFGSISVKFHQQPQFSAGCHSTVFDKNHQYSTISFSTKGGDETTEVPCLEITSYGFDTTKNHRHVLFHHELCGKIFNTTTDDNNNTSSCRVAWAQPTSILLLTVSLGLAIVISVSILLLLWNRNMMNLCQTMTILFFLWFFYAALIFIGSAYDYSLPFYGIVRRLTLFYTALFALLQMIYILYLVIWCLCTGQSGNRTKQYNNVQYNAIQNNHNNFYPHDDDYDDIPQSPHQQQPQQRPPPEAYYFDNQSSFMDSRDDNNSLLNFINVMTMQRGPNISDPAEIATNANNNNYYHQYEQQQQQHQYHDLDYHDYGDYTN